MPKLNLSINLKFSAHRETAEQNDETRKLMKLHSDVRLCSKDDTQNKLHYNPMSSKIRL